jgi:hypothetical protein
VDVHHPHHPTHKKQLREYALEFLMLFLAVTLGFAAENIREELLEKKREVGYLKNVHHDLRTDLVQIDSMIEYIDRKQMLADSLFAMLTSDDDRRDLGKTYYYVKTFALRREFERSDNGLAQLRAAGGFRLIHNDEIIRGMQDYEANLRSILRLQEFNETILVNFRLKTSRVLDVVTSTTMSEAQSISTSSGEILNRFHLPQHPRPFASTDRRELNEMYNLAFSTINTNKYIRNRLVRLRAQATALDATIMREYGRRVE